MSDMIEHHQPAPPIAVCPACGAEEIGVQIQGVYDGILFWACANSTCGNLRNRWEAIGGGKRFVQAEEHMRRWRERAAS